MPKLPSSQENFFYDREKVGFNNIGSIRRRDVYFWSLSKFLMKDMPTRWVFHDGLDSQLEN